MKGLPKGAASTYLANEALAAQTDPLRQWEAHTWTRYLGKRKGGLTAVPIGVGGEGGAVYLHTKSLPRPPAVANREADLSKQAALADIAQVRSFERLTGETRVPSTQATRPGTRRIKVALPPAGATCPDDPAYQVEVIERLAGAIASVGWEPSADTGAIKRKLERDLDAIKTDKRTLAGCRLDRVRGLRHGHGTHDPKSGAYQPAPRTVAHAPGAAWGRESIDARAARAAWLAGESRASAAVPIEGLDREEVAQIGLDGGRISPMAILEVLDCATPANGRFSSQVAIVSAKEAARDKRAASLADTLAVLSAWNHRRQGASRRGRSRGRGRKTE